MIGKMRNKITVNRYTDTQDEGGGTTAVLSSSFSVWAKVSDRTGQAQSIEARNAWPYNYKIEVRYDRLNPVLQGDVIEYDGKQIKINYLQKNAEGKVFMLTLGGNTID